MASYDRIDTTANRLKQAIERLGITQTETARRAGIDKGSMTHYLQGNYEPKKKAVAKIARVLNVSEMWLWGYDCPMERPLEQKNNDILSDIIVRMRTDEDFLSVVESVYNLEPDELLGVKHMLAAFHK